MKFLADESIDFPIIQLLRQQGFDVRSVSEDSLQEKMNLYWLLPTKVTGCSLLRIKILANWFTD